MNSPTIRRNSPYLFQAQDFPGFFMAIDQRNITCLHALKVDCHGLSPPMALEVEITLYGGERCFTPPGADGVLATRR
jgi:hypothetical protein